MKKIKLLYIVGTSRCGSTLLSNLLGLLPGFISVGELRYIWERGIIENWLCTCGKLFQSCDHWQDIIIGAFGSIDNLSVLKLKNVDLSIRKSIYKSKIPNLKTKEIEFLSSYLVKLYSTILQKYDGNVIIDSSKGVGYAYILNHINDFEIYFLHLVRDSRAVTYSRLKRKKAIPKALGEIKKMGTGLNTFSIIEDWNRTNKLAEKYLNINEKYLLVKYEDLVSDPIKYINKIIRFLNINGFNSYDLNDLPKTNEIMHIFSGNPIRFNDDYTNIKVDDEWKIKSSFFFKKIVKLGTNNLMKKYQYS